MTSEERKKIEKWLKKEPKGAFCQMPEYLQRHVEKKAVKVAMKNHQGVSVYLRKIDAPEWVIKKVNDEIEKKRIEKEEKQNNENTEKDKTEAQNKETSVKKEEIAEKRA